jgi:hypothetical protein
MAYKKVIRRINIKKDFLQGSGETRMFEVFGTKNCVVSVEVLNEDGHYYDFSSKSFSATKSKLKKAVLSNGVYRNSITFPKVTDNDEYTIQFYAHPDHNTEMWNGLSNSLIYECTLHQFIDLTLTLSALSPNSLTAFGGVSITTDTVTISRGKTVNKRPFKIVVTAAATRNFNIERQPVESDFTAFVTRTIGSAPIPITGEDTSSSTYYKWPIDNVAGLRRGLYPTGSDLTAGSMLDNFSQDFVITSGISKQSYVTRSKTTTTIEDISYNRRAPSPIEVEDSRYDIPTRTTRTEVLQDRFDIDIVPGDEESGMSDDTTDIKTTIPEVFESAVQPIGPATTSQGIVTAQTGNIVFNKQQADALKDNSIKFYGQGVSLVKSLTNYDIKVSDLKVELTEVTTTTTASTIGASSTSVQITERAGIRDGNFSTVTGIGIDTSSAVPTVASGAGAVNGAGTIVLSAAQELESGITLTFGNASRIATITGTIDVKEAGLSDTTIFLDIERFLTAV